MASKTDIANSALVKIGSKQTITSFNDGTAGANIASLRYDEIRQDLLRSHNWNFATARVKLAKLATQPSFGYQNCFQLPSGSLRTVGVFLGKNAPLTDYRIEGSAISADASDVYLTYIRDVTDVAEMPPDFRECLSDRLAMDMAIPIAGSSNIFQLMESRLERALWRAKSTDSIEDAARQMPAGSWWSARMRSGGAW